MASAPLLERTSRLDSGHGQATMNVCGQRSPEPRVSRLRRGRWIVRRFLAFVPCLLLVGCADESSGPTTGVFAGATRVEVFRLWGDPDDPKTPKPTADEKKISGFRVRAQGQDQGKAFAAKLAAIVEDKGAHSKAFAKCFWPGVAFRVWKDNEPIDVVICFVCHNLYCGPPTTTEARENISFYDSPLGARLVRLAKVAFPDDPEIQALKEE